MFLGNFRQFLKSICLSEFLGAAVYEGNVVAVLYSDSCFYGCITLLKSHCTGGYLTGSIYTFDMHTGTIIK